MSNRFILVHRHEEAHPETSEGDAARPLTARGRVRMHQQARALFDRLPALDHVLCSPKVRAVQTAEILISAGGFDLATPLSCHHSIADPPSLRALLDLIHQTPAPNGHIALVGHEPILSAFVQMLLKDTPFSSFRTGQSVLLQLTGNVATIIASHRGGEVQE